MTPVARPFWWEDAPPEASGDAPPEDVDVAVVGAGYAGLAAALELARAGASVAVFDAGDRKSTRLNSSHYS